MDGRESSNVRTGLEFTMFKSMKFVASGSVLLLSAACSGTTPTSPSLSGASPAGGTQAHAEVSVVGVTRREGRMHAMVRNSGTEINIGLATYKRIYTDRALTSDNLALFSDVNVIAQQGETRELIADAPPCGPFLFVVYHTRSSAGQLPGRPGVGSAPNIAQAHVVSSGTDEWNRWPECVTR
jgi:hypothetical protein